MTTVSSHRDLPSIGRFFERLLLPSWGSAVVCLLAGIAAEVSVLLRSSPFTTTLQQSISGIASMSFFMNTTESINNTTFSPQLAVGVFWAVIGFGIYLIVVSIFSIVSNFLLLRKEMHYVNAHPRALLLNAAADALGHLLVFVGWLLYIRFFLQTLVPWALDDAAISAHADTMPLQVKYAFFAVVIVAVGVYGHVLFMRLAHYWRTDVLCVRVTI